MELALDSIDLSLYPAATRMEIARRVEELKRRRREERSRYFVPTDPSMAGHKGYPANDQRAFYLSPVKERWIFGGNRSGKTEMLVYDCNEFCCGRHPVRSVNRPNPVSVRMCAPPTTKDGSTGVVLEKLQQMVQRKDLLGMSWERAWSPSERILWYNDGRKPKSKGSYIQFKSNEQDVDKYGGWAGDAVYADEHYHIKYYRENKMRLLDRNGFYVHSMTPEDGAITWERKHVFAQNPEISYWAFSVYGNPYLSLEAIQEVENSITDERVKQVKLFGKFIPLSGLVYDNFREALSFIEFTKEIPENWPRAVILDPHIKKEHAILWLALSPEEEIWVYRTMKVNANPQDLKRLIRDKSLGENIVAYIYDEAMGGERVDNFGNQSIGQILTSGDDRLPFVGTNQKSEGKFEAGVLKVRQWFECDPKTGQPRIKIKKPDCYDLIDELNEYQFMPETAADELTFRQKVRHVNDDLATCLRYGVVWADSYIKGWGLEITSPLNTWL